jgi:hypothetical protein
MTARNRLEKIEKALLPGGDECPECGGRPGDITTIYVSLAPPRDDEAPPREMCRTGNGPRDDLPDQPDRPRCPVCDRFFGIAFVDCVTAEQRAALAREELT